MFAKRVPARLWKEYRCDIAQYTETARVIDSGAVEEESKSIRGADERVDDVAEKV